MKLSWKDIVNARVDTPVTSQGVATPPKKTPSRPITPMKPIVAKAKPNSQPATPVADANQNQAQLPIDVPEPTSPVVQPPAKPGFVVVPPTLPPPSPMRQIANPEVVSKMNADGLFIIGRAHDVCQDYVSCHTNGNKSYVVLSDGCSGSSDSDVGARVLVKTHEHYIPKLGEMDFNEYSRRADEIYTQIIEEADANAKSLELSPMALDATVLSIVSNKDGDFIITCYGDGVVALGRHDGVIEVYSVSYKAGFPKYLSYRLSEERQQKFNEKVANEGNHKEITVLEIMPDGTPNERKHKASRDFDIYLGQRDRYAWVAVMSDGVESFLQHNVTETGKYDEQVPLHEVLKELFSFKNFQGTFVKRRVNRFLEVCKERNWTHEDDFSVGVVYLGEPEVEEAPAAESEESN